jgi:hypothetical protein
MASKTNTADLTVRASFALIQGAILAMALPLLYFVLPGYVRSLPLVFLFVVIPILAFGSSMIINWFLQYLYCKSVSINGISMASTISPIFVFGLGGLSYLLPFLRSPIGQLVSDSTDVPLEDAQFNKDLWGYSFYLFWAGVYGQTLGSGMVASCT